MRKAGLVVVLSLWTVRAHGAPQLARPAPETGSGAKVTVPAVPAFEVAGAGPGAHGVQELLVLGKPLLGTQITAQGYVIWIYSCAKIDVDPTACERPKFYLGATKDAPIEKALWVVDVPRPPNKLERERLPKAELAKWPAVPKLAVGAFVAVTGTFTVGSPHGERNSDGLLVFKSVTPLDPAKLGTPTKITPPAPPAVPAPTITKAKPAAVTASAKSESAAQLNAANKAYAARQVDQALTAYKAAVTSWPDNHTAWFGLAGASIAKGDLAAAHDAITHAVTLLPDEPMYWMIDGYVRYEQAHAARPPGDLTGARQSLEYAVKLNPRLWRAHYYLGRIHRDAGFAKAAADEFTLAIAQAPVEPGPYVALAELDRQWLHPDEALAVATLGTQQVSGPAAADLWYVAGMALEDKRDHAKAIDAFTKALEAKPDHAKAKFQRGQAYFYVKDWAHAKVDLDEFLKAGGANIEFAKQQAAKMLQDLATKK